MANILLSNFLARLKNRYAADSDQMSYSEWVAKNTTHKKRPFSYKGYEFQRQIVDDMHPNLSVIKCSQVGLTETQIRKWLAFLKRTTAIKSIYTLPELKMFKRISQTRILPLVAQDKIFNLEDDEKSVRNQSLIQIGQSFGFVTAMTEGDATSIDADALFHDEYDLSDMHMIGLFQSRMQNSVYRITQRFGTPTFVGFGIDAQFGASDQHEFFCKCSSCNHWNIPEFERKFVDIPGLPDMEDLSRIDTNIATELDLLNSAMVCERCRSPLDLGNPEQREYVPRYPERKLHRGYRVTPFSTDRLTIQYIVDQLLKYKQQDYLRGWYNTVLGKPFNDSNARLTEADIRACFEPGGEQHVSRGAPCFVGIDMGLTCHLTLGTPGTSTGEARVFMFEEVPANQIVDRVGQILRIFNVVGGACDRHPYTPTAEEIREISNGKILPVEYRGSAPINFIKDEYETITHAQVNRTAIIDAVARAVRNHVMRMANFGDRGPVLIEHLRDMVRIEKPDEIAIWQKLTGTDHWFHSLAFMLLSMRMSQALITLLTDEIRTEVLFTSASMKPVDPMLQMFAARNNRFQRTGFGRDAIY